MEEDAGKLIHDEHKPLSYVDLNRTGVPLIEIVSEPDIQSPEEAAAYLRALRSVLVYLEICDGNMEEGSFRCDANVSIRPRGETSLGVKTELKNMNSFRNVQRGLQYEIERQTTMLKEGEKIVQETRLFDPGTGTTASMRSKEQAHDYRYFPDPDLLPVIIDKDWNEKLKYSLPELPDAKLNRFTSNFSLPGYDAEILTQSKSLADYYEQVISATDDYKVASNWVTGDVLAFLNEKKMDISNFPLSPVNLGKLINLIKNGTISGKIAKEIFPDIVETNVDPEIIVKEKNLVQISDTSEIESLIQNILDNNPSQVEEYKSGKEKVFGFFVGQVMKESKGKANPQLVNELLKKKLTS